MRRKLNFALYGVASATVLLAATACFYVLYPVPATVCALVRDPGQFRYRSIKTNARIESDGFEWALLVDDYKCPMDGIELRFSKEFRYKPEAALINNNLRRGEGTSYTDIRGTFVGRLSPDRDTQSKFYFMINDTEAVQVNHLAERRKSPFPGL
jgi:hypothetical protein